jgi:pimeloyl-ACP methyl ester carboxylesterase
MATVDRDGVTLYFEQHGSDSSRPTVLLSHGYSATSAMWQGQIAPLTRDFNLITWDMRGHGNSDSPDDLASYSEALTVGDMAAILDVCGVRRAIVGGLSLGGYMTLAFHASFPERCIALMLFDTGPGYKNATARSGWNQTAEARARAFENSGLAALGTGREVRTSSHRSARGLALAARGLLAQVDDRVIQSLPSVQLPTLVLVGALDQPFRIPTDYMAARIPGAVKRVIEATGHASNIDQPEAFNAAVLAFLAQVAK